MHLLRVAHPQEQIRQKHRVEVELERHKTCESPARPTYEGVSPTPPHGDFLCGRPVFPLYPAKHDPQFGLSVRIPSKAKAQRALPMKQGSGWRISPKAERELGLAPGQRLLSLLSSPKWAASCLHRSGKTSTPGTRES